MTLNEREIQKALGTLREYYVTILYNRINSIVGCREMATSPEEAIQQAHAMLRGNTPSDAIEFLSEVGYIAEVVDNDD